MKFSAVSFGEGRYFGQLSMTEMKQAFGLIVIAFAFAAGPAYYFGFHLPQQSRQAVQLYRSCLRTADSDLEQAIEQACHQKDEFYDACIDDGAPKKYCERTYLGPEQIQGCKLPQKLARRLKHDHEFAVTKCLGELKAGVGPELMDKTDLQ